LWGAGQMMFNKSMIIVDDDVDVHDHRQVLNAVCSNTSPSSDMIISHGPLDVLDHSSPSFAYGSKLGIDATRKFTEEIKKKTPPIDTDKQKALEFLHSKVITCVELTGNAVLCSIDKKNQSITGLKQDLSSAGLSGIDFVVLVDPDVDISDLYAVVWVVAANIDPERDVTFIKTPTGQSVAIIDGTFKFYRSDMFPRKWPNVVVSEENTIQEINKRWEDLGLGKCLPSPSLKYSKLHHPPYAVVTIRE
jgi:4-hydroxy-3-polyprenylbenzoate decarboxylase